MMLRDMVESVMEEKDEVRDIGGIRCLLRLGRRRKCARETLLCSEKFTNSNKDLLNYKKF